MYPYMAGAYARREKDLKEGGDLGIAGESRPSAEA
jgi:hypothetical protein